jgi:hypothetical protein
MAVSNISGCPIKVALVLACGLWLGFIELASESPKEKLFRSVHVAIGLIERL